MSSPQEERDRLNDQVDDALSMIKTILRNTELDYDEHGRSADFLNRVRSFRQYLVAFEDDDAEIMAMAVAVALEMITEERIKFQD